MYPLRQLACIQLADILICLIIFLPKGFLETAATLHEVSGCYYVDGCRQMEWTCATDKIIRLDNKQYAYGNRNKCGYKDLNCTIENDTCREEFSNLQAYNLYRSCSARRACSTQATQGPIDGPCASSIPPGHQGSNNVIISYECINATEVVRFCRESSKTMSVVDLMFDGNTTIRTYPNQKCSCTISGEADTSWSVTLEDIRPLRPGNESVCASATMTGFNLSCKGGIDKSQNFIYQQNWDIGPTWLTLENLFALGEDDRPTMVWIRVKAFPGQTVTVTCSDPIPNGVTTSGDLSSATRSRPTSDEPDISVVSTTESFSNGATSSPSFTSDISSDSVSTEFSPVTTTLPNALTSSEGGETSTEVVSETQTAPSSGNGRKSQSGQDEVPAAAIAVPIILVLVGVIAGLGIWYWRRRRYGKDRGTSNVKHNHAYESRSDPRLQKNFVEIVANPGAEYSVIDQSKISTGHADHDEDVGDNYGYSLPMDTVRSNTTEYNVINLKGKQAVLDPNYSRLPGNGSINVPEQEDHYSHTSGPSSSSEGSRLQTGPSTDVYSHLKATSSSSPSDKANVYSHTQRSNLPSITSPTRPGTSDVYSHLAKESSGIKSPSSHHGEDEDTYDHTGHELQGHTSDLPKDFKVASTADGGVDLSALEDSGGIHDYFILEKVQGADHL